MTDFLSLYLPSDKYTRIIIHHSASQDCSIAYDWDGILRYHVCHPERKYRNIGYHAGIEMVDGVYQVVLGRPLMYDGAHCKNYNEDSVGICCVGDWEKDTPPWQVYELCSDLCRFYYMRLGIPMKRIFGHHDFAQTDCPGGNFDMLLLRRMVSNKVHL